MGIASFEFDVSTDSGILLSMSPAVFRINGYRCNIK